MYAKNEKIYPVYVSTQKNSLFFNDDSKQRRMALLCSKNPSALLRGITLKNNSDFFCLNCFHSFRTKRKLNLIKKYVKIKICNVLIIPSEETKILEFNQNH